MSGESLGTAYLQLSVDTAEFEARLNRAKNIGQSLGPEIAQAFQQSDAKARQAITGLTKYVETLGLTQDQVKLLRAAWQGVDGSVIENIGNKIAAVRREAELLAVKTQHAADGAAFAKMADEAERLRRGQQAVAVFTEYLDLMEIKAQHAADGAAFEQMAEQAERLRRGQQAIAAFTEQLDQLEAAEAHAASQQNFLKNLESQSAAIGKTRSELMEMKAAELGVADAAAPFIAKMKAQEEALLGGGNAFNKYGLSVKQTQAALRQVPAQLTDIFVSLQGGQAPLTVLLQQGGQLKDIFGGVRPAVEALGGALLKLINPLTISAAIAAVLFAAWNEGDNESRALAKSLVQVGDSAGRTADQLQATAAISADFTRTQHAVAEALSTVVSSGKFLPDMYGVIAVAAVDMQRATGQALDKTIEQFASLREDPKNAVAELNKTTHFLTLEIYEQVRALQEQGRTQDATRVATEAYADSVISRSAEIESKLGTLQTAWNFVKDSAKKAWDAMLDIGREETPEQKIARLSERVKQLQHKSAFGLDANLTDKGRAELIKQLTDDIIETAHQAAVERNTAQDKAAEEEAVGYLASQQKVVDAHRSADERTAAQIKEINGEYATRIEAANRARNTDLATRLTQQRDQLIKELNAEAAKRHGSGEANAQMKSDVQDFENTLAIQQNAIRNDTRILQSEYSSKTITVEAYYDGLRALAARNTKAQEDALTGEIGVLRSRNASGKDAIDVQTKLAALEAKLAQVRADGVVADRLLSDEEKRMLQQRRDALDSYKFALNEANIALQLQVNAQIAAIGMGQKEAAQHEKIAAIYAKEAEELRKLQYQKDHHEITDAEFNEYVAAARQATEQAVETQRQGYADMLKAQGDWLAGVKGGFEDWAEQTADVASQMRAMTTHDMDTIADSLTNAAETGKFAWRSMLLDMLKELEKFLVKQAMLKAAYALGEMAFNAYAGGGGEQIYAKGGVIEGSASLHSYLNGVYDQPTRFYANGGVFGEAGPEAIMPLARDSSGRLGVEVHGGSGGGAGPINLSINTTLHSDGSSKSDAKASDQDAALKSFSQHMAGVAQQEIRKATQPGGMLWKIGVAS